MSIVKLNNASPVEFAASITFGDTSLRTLSFVANEFNYPGTKLDLGLSSKLAHPAGVVGPNGETYDIFIYMEPKQVAAASRMQKTYRIEFFNKNIEDCIQTEPDLPGQAYIAKPTFSCPKSEAPVGDGRQHKPSAQGPTGTCDYSEY